MNYQELRETLVALASVDSGGDGWEDRYAPSLSPRFNISDKEMATLLKLTKQHHTQHERTTGQPDADWAGWYAEFILDYTGVNNAEENSQ